MSLYHLPWVAPPAVVKLRVQLLVSHSLTGCSLKVPALERKGLTITRTRPPSPWTAVQRRYNNTMGMQTYEAYKSLNRMCVKMGLDSYMQLYLQHVQSVNIKATRYKACQPEIAHTGRNEVLYC